MNQYRMKPFVKPPEFDVTVPGSKSITNRALLLAALAEGRSVLKEFYSVMIRVCLWMPCIRWDIISSLMRQTMR